MKVFSFKSTVVSVYATFSIALGAVFMPAGIGFSRQSLSLSL